jgi:hypothetical protein
MMFKVIVQIFYQKDKFKNDSSFNLKKTLEAFRNIFLVVVKSNG